jgi:hypothetical protein
MSSVGTDNALECLMALIYVFQEETIKFIC